MRKAKTIMSLALSVAMVTSMAATAPVMAAEEEEGPGPQKIVNAEVIAYTTDEALSIAGVRIEYDTDIDFLYVCEHVLRDGYKERDKTCFERYLWVI